VLTEPPVYDDGVLRIERAGGPPRLIVSGEIDESTYPGLVSALADAADGQREVHVNLAGVGYCDLAGLRAIVGMTGASDGAGGRRVVLHEVPAQLLALLGIVGWDCTPGLTLDGRPGAVAGAVRAAATAADGGLSADGQHCSAGA